MARDLRNVVGQLNHAKGYGLTSGFTTPATTDGGASPPIGERWWRADDSAVVSLSVPPNDALATTFDFYDSGAIFRLEGDIGAGTVRGWSVDASASGSMGWRAVGQGAGGNTFKIGIYIGATQRALGSNIFDKNTNLYVLFGFDNSTNEYVVYVNGTEEVRYDIDAVEPGALPNTTAIVMFAGTGITGCTAYWCGGPYWLTRASTDTRPNPDAEILVRDLNGNSATYDQWGDEANCATDGAADYTDLDTYNSDGTPGDSDPANYACTDLDGNVHRQGVTLADTPDHTAGYEIIGAGITTYVRNTAADKSIEFFLGQRESATDLEKKTADVTATTYAARRQVFADTPSGAAWSNTLLDAMEVHIYTTINADGNLICQALGFESVAVKDFEPAVAVDDRRRLLMGRKG